MKIKVTFSDGKKEVFDLEGFLEQMRFQLSQMEFEVIDEMTDIDWIREDIISNEYLTENEANKLSDE